MPRALTVSRLAVLAVLAVVLASCATPQTQPPQAKDKAIKAEEIRQATIAVDNLLGAYKRLYNVAYPLFFAATDICGERVSPRLGWLLANQYDLSGNMREAAVAKYALGNHFTVMHVVANTPAAQAGLQAGDVIVSWNGHSLPSGEQASEQFEKLRKSFLSEQRNHVFGVKRGEQLLQLVAEAKPACNSDLLWIAHDEVNAYADGNTIGITRGMLNFVQSDLELANVVAHELAHNAKGHITARVQNSMLGVLLDVLSVYHGGPAGFQMAAMYHFSPEFEAEADYVGLYILALAGKDYAKAPDFWRRMAALYPGAILHKPGTSHPSTAKRFVDMTAAVEEIRDKLSSNKPLEPNSNEIQ